MTVYTEGRGSYSCMHEFVTLVRGRQIKDDNDVLVGVTGEKGVGKSTFSKQIMIEYVERYFLKGKKFTPNMLEKYTAYTRKDLERLIEELPMYSPIDCDEAVNFAMGEDWMISGNKRMKKIFAKIRNKHFLFFFNIPSLWWLDKKYREGMMNIWVHIVKKGHAVVSLPNVAPGIEDKWYKNWLEKNFTKDPVNYFTPLEKIMKKMRRYPIYTDDFAFPKLPNRFYEKHLELRNVRTLDDGLDDERKRRDDEIKTVWKAQPMWIKKDWEGFKKLYTKVIARGQGSSDGDGGKFTTKDIYNFFYRDFNTGEPLIKNPRTLDQWMHKINEPNESKKNVWE